MPDQPVIRPPAAGRTIAVVGDLYRFLATGEETNGAYASFEAIVPPGGGPPPHVHRREQESFYVMEGQITFTVNGQRQVASAGSFAHMPIGIPHSFKNETDKPAKMLITVVPAGLENLFRAFGIELPEGSATPVPPSQAEIDKLIELAPDYGIELLIPDHGH